MGRNDLLRRGDLLDAYDAAHEGPPGGARKLIEEAPAIGGWISVKDRLPKSDGKYLAYYGMVSTRAKNWA